VRNEVVEKDQLDQHRASLDYVYGIQSKPIEPFKNLSKSVWLKWLTELNLNPVPSSFTFGTVMDRKFGERTYRFSDPIYETWFEKRFTWVRTYSLRWDLSRSIKINFNAANAAVIDEPDEYISRPDLELIDPKDRKDAIWDNIREGGRTKDYNHQMRATFAVPLKSIPLVDWVKLDLGYDATYSWKAAAINTDSLGNVIQNGQKSTVSTEFDFTKLYNKSKYLAKVNKPGGATTNKGPRTPPGQPSNPSADPKKDDPNKSDADKAKDDKKKSQEISPPLKVALRLLMAVRKFRVNYGETNGTTIPGFTPQSEILGMSSGFGAPGWSFISGIQPKINRKAYDDTGDYLADARDNGWITTNAFQNAPLQFKTKSLDSRLSFRTIYRFQD
jgi:cell surface protein SprA